MFSITVVITVLLFCVYVDVRGQDVDVFTLVDDGADKTDWERVVEICDDLIVIGRSHPNDPDGYVDLLTINTSGAEPRWRATQRLRPDERRLPDLKFGVAVACSSTDHTVWVGEPGFTLSSGRVYEFKLTNDNGEGPSSPAANWTFVRFLGPSQPATRDQMFGLTLAVGGDTLAIGSLRMSLVDLYRRNPSTGDWTFDFTLKVAVEDDFGFGQALSVASDGNTVLAGMPYVRDAALRETGGGARAFTRSGTEWVPGLTFIPPGTLGGEECGSSVHLVEWDGTSPRPSSDFGVLLTCAKPPGGVWFFTSPSDARPLLLSETAAEGVAVFGHTVSVARDYWLLAGVVYQTHIGTALFKFDQGNWTYLHTYFGGPELQATFGMASAISANGLVLITSPSGSFLACIVTPRQCPGYGPVSVTAESGTTTMVAGVASTTSSGPEVDFSLQRSSPTPVTLGSLDASLAANPINEATVDLSNMPLWLILVITGAGALFCGCGLMLLICCVCKVCLRRDEGARGRRGVSKNGSELSSRRTGRHSRSQTRGGRSRGQTRRRSTDLSGASVVKPYGELSLRPLNNSGYENLNLRPLNSNPGHYDPGPVPSASKDYALRPGTPGYLPSPPPNYSGSEGSGFPCPFCSNVYPTDTDVSIHITKRHESVS